jgi:hypothetical protein
MIPWRHTFLRASRLSRRRLSLDSFIQVDKNEWNAFLEAFSEFEKKYELLLGELDNARSRLRASSSEARVGGGIETPSKASPGKTVERMGGVTGGSFFDQLKAKLETLSISPSVVSQRSVASLSRNQAACSRCGFKIVRATRVCQGCGADFGGMVCVCGRSLSSADKFCDRCGRGV